MNAVAILNPYANRWNARARRAGVLAALRAAGVRFDAVETAGPGDATRLAREAALAGAEAVIAIGGDGTVSEVANGLLLAAEDGPTVPLGVIPLGTGNDFADMAGLPRDARAAAGIIASGRRRPIDAARVTYGCRDDPPIRAGRDAQAANTTCLSAAVAVRRFFDNNCALAMEPLVTIENTRIRRVSGNMRYILALLRALRKLTAWDMRVTWDEGTYTGPVHLLSVCNSPRCGGLFLMAPGALMDDGLLDVVLAPRLSKWEILTILPRLLRGTHLRHPRIRRWRTRRLSVHSTPPTPIHADGEVLTESATRIDYETLPGRLTLLAPAET